MLLSAYKWMVFETCLAIGLINILWQSLQNRINGSKQDVQRHEHAPPCPDLQALGGPARLVGFALSCFIIFFPVKLIVLDLKYTLNAMFV